MSKIIRKIVSEIPVLPKTIPVAAYARVSSGKEAMLHSLSEQVSYYSDYIQRRPDWDYAGVYADEALTGTKKNNRDGFNRLIDDCRAGKVQFIVTKSISRFARNTIDLLSTVRELRSLGVGVYFEEQEINTLSGDGELLLTVLAAYAQEESRTVSENQRWRVKHNFENGRPWNCTMLGYRYRGGVLVIEPQEAEVVRGIFADYISGVGLNTIAKRLNETKIPTRHGGRWCKNGVQSVLRNPAYTGRLVLQRTFHENHLTKRKCFNKGELPMYIADDSHEAIIAPEVFETVQAEMARRAVRHTRVGIAHNTYEFTGKIVCGICGKHYRRKICRTQTVWICPTFNTLGKGYCPSKQIPESVLTELSGEHGGMEYISQILVIGPNTLVSEFCDGRSVERQWADRSRSESWTPEMREAARRRSMEGVLTNV
jgi:DNA invertase Pin-like site-specific DNA recombinase